MARTKPLHAQKYDDWEGEVGGRTVSSSDHAYAVLVSGEAGDSRNRSVGFTEQTGYKEEYEVRASTHVQCLHRPPTAVSQVNFDFDY